MAVGLYLVRHRRKKLGLGRSDFRAWDAALIFTILVNLYLLIMPWYPPTTGATGGDVSFWYATYVVVGIGIFGGYQIRQESLALGDGAATHRLVKVKNEDLAAWDENHDAVGRKLAYTGEDSEPRVADAEKAKNSTRQNEHLSLCQAYLSSLGNEKNNTDSSLDSGNGATLKASSGGILNGTVPNPNLQVQRGGRSSGKKATGPRASSSMPRSDIRSLTTHLLHRFSDGFTAATQHPFLTHAGCGSLSGAALSEWLTQDSHYARGYVAFIGGLIAKVRLPHTSNTQFHILYRTLDLLISALNNVRREMSFFEITATKYGLTVSDVPPTPICRAYLDLFRSASSPGASLLEGIVVLWATEHCYHDAWSYAASCTSNRGASGAASAIAMPPPPTAEAHVLALHHALIPNWTSPAFGKFVDACRALVDDLAVDGSGGGEATWASGEMVERCEEHFRQVCWLEERFWPMVDGMGEPRDGETGGQSGIGGTGEGNERA
ncbi:MAG: hypothetical protein M1822_006806 [Bathelium mastoideum]|nr:MAG: hypothetical protein M1822_006806 [Bathelium mastoideum]